MGRRVRDDAKRLKRRAILSRIRRRRNGMKSIPQEKTTRALKSGQERREETLKVQTAIRVSARATRLNQARERINNECCASPELPSEEIMETNVARTADEELKAAIASLTRKIDNVPTKENFEAYALSIRKNEAGISENRRVIEDNRNKIALMH